MPTDFSRGIASAKLSLSADERKKQASSEIANNETEQREERRGEPVSIFSNTTIRLLPRVSHVKMSNFKTSKDALYTRRVSVLDMFVRREPK